MDQRDHEEKGEKLGVLEQLELLEDLDHWVHWVSEEQRETREISGKRVIRVGQDFRVYQVEEDFRVKTDKPDHPDLQGTEAQGVSQVNLDLQAQLVTTESQEEQGQRVPKDELVPMDDLVLPVLQDPLAMVTMDTEAPRPINRVGHRPTVVQKDQIHFWEMIRRQELLLRMKKLEQ